MHWKLFFKSLKNKDMLRRIGTVLAIVAVFRFLAQVPVPLAEPTQLQQAIKDALESTDLGGFVNLLAGGGLSSFSIVAVGISPYITASIATQLLTKAIPSIEELSEDGETGRRKINQWTRLITVPLAILQSVAYIIILRQTVVAGSVTALTDMDPKQWILAVTAMTAGSVLLMWLGELITEQGIANGISTIIFVGIVSQMPQMVAALTGGLFDTTGGQLDVFGWFTVPINPYVLWMILFIAVIGLILLFALVKINEAQRLIQLNYAKRVHGNSKYGDVRSVMPLRLITAGVIPIIFAVALLSLPSFVGQALKSMNNASPGLISVADRMVELFTTPTATDFATGRWQAFVYPITYFLLIVMFTYFYTSITFNPKEISDNLQKQGGFVVGVRPGSETEKYFKSIITRLTLFGSVALGLIALTPFLIDWLLFWLFGQQNINLAIAGSGGLIIVTVALESLRQVSSRALMITYDEYEV